ncbi:MAG: heavy-metal-associated domain-containing protein [bacterium]|nr:heavy-metal-associated domain-containing protein [bacterium]
MTRPLPSRPEPKRSVPIWLRITAAGLLLLLSWIAYQAISASLRAPAPTDPVTEFFVEGLDCPVWCAVRLTDGIDELDGAQVVEWNPRESTVKVQHDPARQDVAALTAILERAGYPVLAAVPQ